MASSFNNDRSSSESNRPRSPLARRMLIVGLDGATFDVLGPLMEQGRMPRLRAVLDAGASGTLYSTVPPITPAAWTTFLTGKQPGTHRILDFEGYDVNTGRLSLNSSHRVGHVRNLWQILSGHGLKVGSVNVPLTYPPFAVNGFLVTGFETPSSESNFAYPPELKQAILQRWPDPTLKAKWRRKVGGGEKLFQQNLDYLSNSFHQGAEMTTWLGDKFGWDVLMVVFKLVDNLQHKTWKYIDPRWADRNPMRRDRVIRCFEELDKAIGTLTDYARAHGSTVLMVSDHGHGSLEGKVYPNRLLEKWGYLKLRARTAQLARGARRRLRRFATGKNKRAPIDDIQRYIPLDLSGTRACVMHAGNAGFLYINLRGRQPGGIVEPADYELLRKELEERFMGGECRVHNPEGKEVQLFTAVHRPEELYSRSREDEPWMPDLILIQHETLAVVRRMRGKHVVRWIPYRRLEGTHRKEGILVACGPGIAKTKNVSAHLVDCAPTILGMLGLPIPSDMEGRVLHEILERPVTLQTEAPGEALTVQAHEDLYTEKELRQVTERLADLGYLE